jgi:hypothetical protein
VSHSNTTRMLGYWEERRIRGAPPLRSTIDPADFAEVVTQAFLIGREQPGAYPFRLAGALMEDLHRGPLVGLDFLQLWANSDRMRIQGAVETAFMRREALIVTAHGRNLAGAQTKLEILLAPLADRHGKVERMLGFYQPVSPLFRLQDQPIERLFLLEIAFADGGDSVAASLRLASVDGRLIA